MFEAWKKPRIHAIIARVSTKMIIEEYVVTMLIQGQKIRTSQSKRRQDKRGQNELRMNGKHMKYLAI